MPRLELFHFRYRDPLTGKWKRARYVAERHEIAKRHTEYEILGPVEIREVDPEARYFSPHVARAHLPAGEPPQSDPPRPEKEPPGKDPPVKEPPEKDPPVKEPPVEDPATLDGLERFLLGAAAVGRFSRFPWNYRKSLLTARKSKGSLPTEARQATAYRRTPLSMARTRMAFSASNQVR